MPDRVPVLIVGAGPVGLSLALGLARCGVESIVIEKNASTSEQSRAPGVWSRTLEIFDGWGVVDDLLATGTYLPHVEIWAAGADKPQIEISFDSLGETTPYPGILILSQSKTEAVLARLLNDEPLADVRFSSELLDWTESDKGVVARVAAAEGEVEIEASYLVGCDGAHSRVRHKLGLHLEGKTYDSHVSLADVRIDDREFPWPRLGFSDGPLIGLYLEDGLWRIIAISSEAGKDSEIDDAELDGWVRGVFGGTTYTKAWTSTFNIHSRVCPSFHRKRVLLAGDAGHLNSPAGGQGMNSGIQDAHNLAWKLARALGGGDSQKLLASYDVERQQAVRRYVNRTTDFLTRAVVQSGGWGRSLFASAAQTGLKIGAIRRTALRRMSMLDIRYRESPLFPAAHRLVGQRAPNCEIAGVDGVARLHELLRDGPSLLWLGYGALPTGLAGVTVRQELLSAATAPVLFDELGIDGTMAVLVRPDGFIGLALENPAIASVPGYVSAAVGDA